jgi:hypothetical protein
VVDNVVGVATTPRVDSFDSTSAGLSWPAILAGAFVAAAMWFSLMALGAGMGLSSVSPWPLSGASARQVAPGAIIWIMIVQALSCSLGGYLAGRLRNRWASIHGHEVHFRDTAHGFLVWAVGLVMSVAFLSSMGVTMAKDATMAAAEGGNDYFVDSLFRAEHSTATAPDSPVRSEDRQAAKKEAAAIAAKALGRTEIAPQDKGYLADLVAANTGLDRARAEARVNDTVAAARQAMDTARKAVAHSLYWLFAALLLGAFCGSFAATIGGRKRDNVVYVGVSPTGRI